MRFKKFKAKYTGTPEPEPGGKAPTHTEGQAQPEPAPSDEYLRSLRHFHENEGIDMEDDEDDQADYLPARPVFPPNPPYRREKIPEGYYDINTAARIAERPPQKIRDWIRDKRLIKTRWGRRVLLEKTYFKNALAAWRKGREYQGPPPPPYVGWKPKSR